MLQIYRVATARDLYKNPEMRYTFTKPVHAVFQPPGTVDAAFGFRK